MKILFIDHECHKKTRSSRFFLDILRSDHEVTEFYYKKAYEVSPGRALVDWADVVVFWEFLPHRFNIAYPSKRCVYVPMYDNEWQSKWIWRRIGYSGMSVISFCGEVSRHARMCGVKNILDVKYALKPEDFSSAKTGRKVLYWDRGEFSESSVRSIFADGAVDEIKIQRGFLPREEYEKMRREYSVYVQPRSKEGIGMAFLEQIAMGNCVIANAAPTMSEYIADGVNGILRDFSRQGLSPVTGDEIQKALNGVKALRRDIYERWLSDREKIAAFFASSATSIPQVKNVRTLRHLVLFMLTVCEWCVKFLPRKLFR